VGIDAGYAAAAIPQGLEERSIYGVIGYRLPTHRDGYFYKREYRYDEKLDVYICPNGQLLNYRTTNREGNRQYHSDADKCANCPVRQKCTQSANLTKVVTRHVWEASRERIDQHRLSRVGKRIYKRRKETGAQLRRRQTTAWPSLCENAWVDSCAATVPVGGHRAEHQEDRSASGQKRQQNARSRAPDSAIDLYRSTAPLLQTARSSKLAQLNPATRNKPHPKDGVRQQSGGRVYSALSPCERTPVAKQIHQ
jgi:hypothetical protein